MDRVQSNKSPELKSWLSTAVIGIGRVWSKKSADLKTRS